VSETMVWVDGRLVPAARATVSALDRGLRSGEGVYETLRVRQRRGFRLAAHLDRLTVGAGSLGIRIDPDIVHDGIAAVVAANDHLGDDVVVRVTCTAGPLDLTLPFPGAGVGPPTVVITAQRTRAPHAPPRPPARGYLVDLRRELPTIKSTASLVSLVAQREARAHGASDAILCDAAGRPLEAAAANLAAVVRGQLVTAPVDAGILGGVTRTALGEVATGCGLAVEERTLERAELLAAEEALLTSAVRGVQPLVRVDGQAIAQGTTGPVTARLRRGLEDLIGATAEPLALSRSPAG
jgi:branched-chain amino acid aminotransferase